MSWVFTSPDFDYEDWAPYAVFEGEDVLVVKSEGDYFFAVKMPGTAETWVPLPSESESHGDIERLRRVLARLYDGIGPPAESLVPRIDCEQTDEYDTLWGIAQKLSSLLTV